MASIAHMTWRNMPVVGGRVNIPISKSQAFLGLMSVTLVGAMIVFMLGLLCTTGDGEQLYCGGSGYAAGFVMLGIGGFFLVISCSFTQASSSMEAIRARQRNEQLRLQRMAQAHGSSRDPVPSVGDPGSPTDDAKLQQPPPLQLEQGQQQPQQQAHVKVRQPGFGPPSPANHKGSRSEDIP